MYRYCVTLPVLMFVLALPAYAEQLAQDQAAPPTPTTPPAAAGSTVLPGTVAAALAELSSMCSDAGGTPRTDTAVRRVDLNGDGHDDFILYTGWISCENAWSIYGDREKLVEVFAGDGANGAALAFTANVYDARIDSADGRQTLWLTTSGQACGRPPAATFAEETFCERAVVAQGPAKFEFAPVSTVRMIE